MSQVTVEYYRHNHGNTFYYGDLSGSQFKFNTRATPYHLAKQKYENLLGASDKFELKKSVDLGLSYGLTLATPKVTS